MVRSMRSVEVVGPVTLFEKTVEAVQDAGVLHIEEVPLSESAGPGRLNRFRLSEDQEKEKTALEGLLRILDQGAGNVPPFVTRGPGAQERLIGEYRRWVGASLAEVDTAARVLYSKVRALVRRERNLADDLQVLTSYEEIAAALAPLVEGRELPEGFSFLGVIFERGPRTAEELLKRELGRLTDGQFRFYTAGLSKGGTAALVGFPGDCAAKVRDFIAKTGISEMILPRYLKGKPFEEALASLEADLESLRVRHEELKAQSRRFYEESGFELLALQHRCRDLFARYEVLDSVARTQYAFVLRGWVLGDELERFVSLLRGRAGSPVLVRVIEPRNMGRPPVILHNPPPIRPFEVLLSLFPLPRYGSIDPTALVAAFFPPIFGLMLGDVGYGFLVAVAAAAIFLFGGRRPMVRRFSVVLGFCAFFAMAFGFVFGELFGNAGRAVGLHPLWRERFSLSGENMVEIIIGYLAVAVGVGVLHVLFGLVLGVFNARRFGDRSQVVSNLARIAGVAVLFFFVGRLVKLLPPVFTSMGVVALVAFLVLMIYQTIHDPLHGLMLPMEVLGTIGNILSYARIMAIGLASVVLALVANMFGGMIGNVVLAAVVVILVHAMNLALGILDPTIQGLRLHYVEFFTKFYITGGRKFSPFKKIGGTLA